jgi:muskelin
MDTMTLALHGGLNNDSQPETFDLKRTNEAGLLRPVRYVKIVPLSCVPMPPVVHITRSSHA